MRYFPKVFLSLAHLTFLAILVFAMGGAETCWAKGAKRAAQTKFMPKDEVVLAEAQILPDKEMAELRAGFIDPTGFIYKFAVDVQSHVNGALMFVRSLVLQPGLNGHFEATKNTQLLAENLPDNTKADVLDQGAGVVLTSEEGKTTLLNQTSNHSFTNVILNTANNRIVSQTMNIDLVLQNMKIIMAHVSSIKNINAPTGLHQLSRMHTVGFGL